MQRLRPGFHRREIDEFAAIAWLRFGPDHLHRFNPLTRQLVARGEDGAVVFNLILVPAIADTKQEAPARDVINRCNRLRGLDRVSLHHQANAGAQQ